MAKVVVRNTREHAIHLNVGKHTTLIPAAKQNPSDRSKIIHGTAVVESEHLEEAKKHPVASHYFKEGWLVVTEAIKAAVGDNGNQQQGNQQQGNKK